MKENETQKQKSKKIIAVISSVVVVLVAISAIFTYCVVRADSGKIYPNTYIGNFSVGNMTPADAKKLLENKLTQNHILTFYSKDDKSDKFEISGNEISFNIDVDKSIENVIANTKNNGLFKKGVSFIKTFIKPNKTHLCVSYDADMLTMIFETYLADSIADMVPLSVTEGEDCLILNNGASGRVVNMKKVDKLIKKDACDLYMNTPLKIEIDTITPEPFDADKFYKEYNREVKDATYTEKNGVYEFQKELNGIALNYNEVVSIIEENRNNTEDYIIPAVITKAEITVESLERKFISRVISAYTTSFATSDANRAHNVMLAASKIDGVILNPGDTFSYNKVVGPRTAATGFKNAHVYEGNRIVDGMGGGICQVSSTLYNTVLMADLKIVKRTNHSMPVGYVPAGRDATVSYGTIDFVFQNDKTYPIKICATIANRTLTISIEGVSDMDYTVQLYTETVASSPFTVREVFNENLAPDQSRVIQNGTNGSTVYTYKIYKRDGVQFNKKTVGKSVYNPIEKIVETGKNPQDEPIENAPSDDEAAKTDDAITDSFESDTNTDFGNNENAEIPENSEQTENEDALAETDIIAENNSQTDTATEKIPQIDNADEAIPENHSQIPSV